MGNASGKKKDEGGARRASASTGDTKFEYGDYINKEPAEVGSILPLSHVSPLVIKLLKDEDVPVKRVLIYCYYIIAGKEEFINHLYMLN